MKYILVSLFLLSSCDLPSGTKLPDVSIDNVDKMASYAQKIASTDTVESFVKGKVQDKVSQYIDTGKINEKIGLVDSLVSIEGQVESLLNKLK